VKIQVRDIGDPAGEKRMEEPTGIGFFDMLGTFLGKGIIIEPLPTQV
jgi:hypothetical protein